MATMIPEIVCPMIQQKQCSSDQQQQFSSTSSPSGSTYSCEVEVDTELRESSEGRQLRSPPCPPIIQNNAQIHHVNLQDKSGKSLLIHCCARGLNSTVEELSMDQDIDVNLADVEGNTALIHAAQAGHTHVVELLISRFAKLEIDHVNKLGQTALIKAAIQGRANCARILLNAGADPEKRDNGRQLTAMEWAEFVGRTECAKVIGEFTEHPKRRSKKSLHNAAQDNFKQVACLAAIPLIGGEVNALGRPRVRSAPPTPTVKIEVTPPSSPLWNLQPTAELINRQHSPQQLPFKAISAGHRSSSKKRPLVMRKYEQQQRPKSSIA